MPDPDEVQNVRLLRMQLAYGSQYQGPITTVMLTQDLGVSPDDLLATLVNTEKHSELVKHPVQVSEVAGAPVHLSPDQGDGYVMEFLGGSHVTFALHPAAFPDTHYSTVTFLTKAYADGRTRLTFYQQNVPADLAPSVKEAWERDYLKPLAEAFPS